MTAWRTVLYLLMAVVAADTAAAGTSADAVDDRGPPRLDGYSGQYTLLTPVRTARETPFLAADGRATTLGEFRGKVVLLSFWATWCAPCIREMPALDRLMRDMGGDDFAVIPVSIDKGGVGVVANFYRRHRLAHLPIYLDPEQRTAYLHADNPHNAAFALYGLPIAYVVDRAGRVRGYITGAVDWDSEAARNLIRYYLRQDGG